MCKSRSCFVGAFCSRARGIQLRITDCPRHLKENTSEDGEEQASPPSRNHVHKKDFETLCFPQVGFWNSLFSLQWKTLQAKRIKEYEFPLKLRLWLFLLLPSESMALSKVTRKQPTQQWELELHNCTVTIKLMQSFQISVYGIAAKLT